MTGIYKLEIQESEDDLDQALSRDACKNRQDELNILAVSRFQRFLVGDESLPPTAVECYANSLHNPHTA